LLPDAEGVPRPAQQPHERARVRAFGRHKRHWHGEHVAFFGPVQPAPRGLLGMNLKCDMLTGGWVGAHVAVERASTVVAID